jgi:hypothetical protein
MTGNQSTGLIIIPKDCKSVHRTVRVVDDEISDADELVVEEILSDVGVVHEIVGERSIVAVQIHTSCDQRLVHHLTLDVHLFVVPSSESPERQ